jgi:hypothetical protein
MVASNTEKFVGWLNLLDQALARGEVLVLQSAVSHLTAAGTVLEDRQAVYISEFLEYLVDNLGLGLRAKKDTSEYKESTAVLHEAFLVAAQAFKEPRSIERMHEALAELRYRATRLQLTKLRGLRSAPRGVLSLEDFEESME